MEGSKPAPRCVRKISIIENGVVRHPMARSRDDVILAHTHISNVEFRRRIVGQHGRSPSSLRPRRLSCAMRAARDVRVAVAMPGSGCAPNVGLRSCARAWNASATPTPVPEEDFAFTVELEVRSGSIARWNICTFRQFVFPSRAP
jgi:hypothetical protein